MLSNDIKIADDQTDLKPGQIRFLDNFLPKLQAGPYNINVSQTIEGDELAPPKFQRNQAFIVDGPRFVLPEDEIHSVYPPPDLQANYRGVVPQVILRKRNMPWERKVYDKGNDFSTPWIALLLFQEEEILLEDAEASATLRTRSVSRETSQMIKPPKNYLPPLLKPSPETDEKQCYTIDLDKKTFLNFAPRLDELPFLTHVREVNTDDKEFLGMHANGWFGVVSGNRLPKTPPEIKAGSQADLEGKNFVRNIVHLVSLEGFTGYLADSPEKDYKKNLADPALNKVRLASLASWEFYCKPPTESFIKIMERLGTGMVRVADTGSLDNKPAVQKAFKGGFTPLQYHTRIGEQTLSWYRGPLLPVIKNEDPIDNETFFSAEAGLIYDEENGVFDASYATAWQIGRLLALSDAHFAESLLNWKRTAMRKINEYYAREKIQKDGDKSAGSDPFNPDEIAKLLNPDFALNAFFKHFIDQVNRAKTKMDEKSIHPLGKIDEELKDFPGIIKEDDYRELFKLGKELQQALVDELLNSK